jgi:hypothetical protein
LPNTRNIVAFDVTLSPQYNHILEQESNVLVWVFDHHATAMKEYKEHGTPRVLQRSHFNTKKSGVGLAWDFFFPHRPIPTMIRYIQDNDLGKWTDTNVLYFTTKWIETLNGKLGIDYFVERDAMVETSTLDMTPQTIQSYIKKGRRIVIISKRIFKKLTDDAALEPRVHFFRESTTNTKPVYKAHNVAVMNTSVDPGKLATYLYQSKYPHNASFAMAWTTTHSGNYRVFLRGTGETIDLQDTIAAPMGGGGHPGASSFTTSLNPVSFIVQRKNRDITNQENLHQQTYKANAWKAKVKKEQMTWFTQFRSKHTAKRIIHSYMTYLTRNMETTIDTATNTLLSTVNINPTTIPFVYNLVHYMVKHLLLLEHSSNPSLLTIILWSYSHKEKVYYKAEYTTCRNNGLVKEIVMKQDGSLIHHNVAPLVV